PDTPSPPPAVPSIFAPSPRLLRPGGSLVYFEYALVRQLKAAFVNRRERRRLFRVGRLVARYVQTYQVRRERIFINVPPAIVRQLRLKPNSCVEPPRSLALPAGC